MNIKAKLVISICTFILSASGYAANTVMADSTKQDVHSQAQDDNKDLKKKKKDDSKKLEKKNEYDELIKKGGTIKKGLFTVRHIEDKWYFEVPDSIIGRYLLAVTRLTAVPQGLGKFSGEEVNENTLYFEKREYHSFLPLCSSLQDHR